MKNSHPPYDSLIDELRSLTEQTRKLREELRGMVDAPKSKDLTRALIHTHRWPRERRHEERPATPERRRKPK
jgi:hypothetical protein